MRRLIAIALAAVGIATPVAAVDWQYTRWGMSVAELVSASAGSVHEVPPEGEPAGRAGVKMAVGEYAAGPFRMTARFLFHEGLTGVRLEPKPADCGNLEYWLIDKYGERQGSTGQSRMYIWRLEGENTQVFFSAEGRGAEERCRLHYSALRHRANAGL